MTTAYSYGGEFSSDDDFESNLAATNAKKNPWSKVAEEQLNGLVSEVVSRVRSLPADADFEIADEVLAAALDRFKAQHGPIVDSTRKLYKKILLAAIKREEANNNNNNSASTNPSSDNYADAQTQSDDQFRAKDLQASPRYNKNNNESLTSKWYKEKQTSSTANEFTESSDDDEPIIPKLATHGPRYRNVLNEIAMEVDHQQELVISSDESSTTESESSFSESDYGNSRDQKEEDVIEESIELDTEIGEISNSNINDVLKVSSGNKVSTEIVDTPTHSSEMGSSTPIIKSSRVRKLAELAETKRQVTEKPIAIKRRPNTRSQRESDIKSSPTQTTVDGHLINSEVSSKSTFVTRKGFLKTWHKCVIVVLLIVFAYALYIKSQGKVARAPRMRYPIEF